MRTKSSFLFTAIVASLLNAGCSGGVEQATDSTTTDPESGGLDNFAQAADNSELVSSQSWELWLREGLQFADDDSDGISNADDPYPKTPPTFGAAKGERSLEVLSVWTEVDSVVIKGVALQGRRLTVDVSGSPDAVSERLWVVAHTQRGLRAHPATLNADGTVSAVIQHSTHEIHLVAGSTRGAAISLESLRPEQPLLMAQDGVAIAGSKVTIRGKNLAGITHVTIGDTELPAAANGVDSIAIQLPSSAAGNQLRAYSNADFSNLFTLDFEQIRHVTLASDVELTQGEYLVTWVDGEELELRHGATLELNTPAWKRRHLVFDIVHAGGTRTYNALETIVWPDDETQVVSAETTLKARVARVQTLLGIPDGEDWKLRRQRLDPVLSLQNSQVYLSAIREYVAGRAGVPSQEALAAVFDAYAASVVDSPTSKTAIAGTAKPLTPFGALDEMIASTFTSTDPSPNKRGAETAGGYVYPPDEANQVFSNDYSQIAILRHEGTSLNRPSFRGFQGCAYSSQEQEYKRLRDAVPDDFNKVWRSDLCMQVDGVVFVSAAIIKPGTRPIADVLDDLAAGKASSEELVRRHSRAELVDTKFQYGPGGYYLRSNNDFPQCHMEACYVEIITSGYGVAFSNTLRPAEEELVSTLRVRMWVESFLTWMLSIAGVDPTNTGVADCLRNGLISGDSGFYAVAEQLGNRIDRVKDLTGNSLLLEIYDAVDQTVAPWLRDFVSGRLGQQYVECFAGIQPTDQLLARVEGKLLDVAGLTAFAEVLTAVRNIGSAALTPEKFLFKLQPRAEITSFEPRFIDLNTDDESLSIRGDWLIQLSDSSADRCSGDAWCPEVVFTDQYGFEARFQTDASHFINVQNGCGIDCTLLQIPFSDLLSAIPSSDNISKLFSGPLDVQLAIAGEGGEYDSYPGDELRLQVPGGGVELQSKPRLDSISPPLVRPGDSVTVKGTGISLYGSNPVFYLRDSDGLRPDIKIPIDGANTALNTSVRLLVPQTVSRGQYYVVMTPDPNLQNPELTELQSNDRSPLLVLADVVPLIVAGDTGVVRDDLMRVELLAVNNSQVFSVSPPRPLAWDLPTNQTNPRVPPGSYVYGESWNDCPDADGNIGVTALVDNVKVTCVSAGSDDVCSVSLRSAREAILVDENGSEVSRQSVSTTIAEGQSKQFYLEFPADRCQ